MTFRVEEISDIFTKFHLEGPWPFHPAMHRFTKPDPSYPHDHPWGFTSHVLHGGYVERVYYPHADGTWHSELHERLAGTSHTVTADHIHQIISLIGDECWTLVMAGPQEREVCFWEFDDAGYRQVFPFGS